MKNGENVMNVVKTIMKNDYVDSLEKLTEKIVDAIVTCKTIDRNSKIEITELNNNRDKYITKMITLGALGMTSIVSIAVVKCKKSKDDKIQEVTEREDA